MSAHWRYRGSRFLAPDVNAIDPHRVKELCRDESPVMEEIRKEREKVLKKPEPRDSTKK